jgi:hypothetical protein
MRLIDADALIENLTMLAKCEDDFRANVVLGVVSTVRNTKTIDAVPVVRCKDCKHGSLFCEGKQLIECTLDDYELVNSDDFCSYGERKDGDG